LARRKHRRQAGAELLFQVREAIEIDVEERDLGFEAERHTRGVGARNAAAEHHDFSRRHTRRTA
jgi:hypothetical protein